MYTGFYVKWPLFLSDFKEMLILWTDFRKNVQIQNFMNICPGNGVGSMRTNGQDRRLDRNDIADSCFSYFCEHT